MDKTSTLTGEMQTYYEKVFLARAEYEFILDQGGQKRSQGQNSGKVLHFNRYTPLTKQTTALTEGVNPPVSTISAATVEATLQEYGLTLKISKFLSLTSIDVNNAEKIALLGQNMGESLNALVRLELDNGTARFTNSKTSSTIASSDTFNATEVRDTVTALEDGKAKPFQDGFFMGKTTTHDKNKLLADSTWVNAKTYSDAKDLYRGEMGELYQVRFLLNKDATTSTGTGSSSTVTLYHTYIHGADAFGVYDLDGDKPKLYIVPDTVDSGNPAGRFATISWAGSYVCKILNSDWIRVLKSA